MRDFLPKDVAKRKYIMQTISEVFQLFGFQAIETPVMENIETLMGKYGEEGDRLLFKVLNSGDYLEKVDEHILSTKETKKLTAQIVEKGLRYDLTVPLARYVVQNQNDLSFPFKRFHIAPVWRADRPQKGRYREFYQCDADVIGSESLYNEVELIQIYALVFEKLNLDVSIKYNNRKILMGLMEAIGLKEKAQVGIIILDKLDKIGIEKVMDEFEQLGLDESQLALLEKVVCDNDLDVLPATDLIQKGKEELAFIQSFNIQNATLDVTLARGLDYYTGCIFEVVSNEYSIGSIGGGGRYDNLTEMFGKSDLTGVGISFGLDRIYDVIEAVNKFPEELVVSSKLLFVHFSAENQAYAFKALQEVRKAGISSEIYPDNANFKKQLKYANDKNIPFVAICGDNEMAEGKFMLKNMASGEQVEVGMEEILRRRGEI